MRLKASTLGAAGRSSACGAGVRLRYDLRQTVKGKGKKGGHGPGRPRKHLDVCSPNSPSASSSLSPSSHSSSGPLQETTGGSSYPQTSSYPEHAQPGSTTIQPKGSLPEPSWGASRGASWGLSEGVPVRAPAPARITMAKPVGVSVVVAAGRVVRTGEAPLGLSKNVSSSAQHPAPNLKRGLQGYGSDPFGAAEWGEVPSQQFSPEYADEGPGEEAGAGSGAGAGAGAERSRFDPAAMPCRLAAPCAAAAGGGSPISRLGFSEDAVRPPCLVLESPDRAHEPAAGPLRSCPPDSRPRGARACAPMRGILQRHCKAEQVEPQGLAQAYMARDGNTGGKDGQGRVVGKAKKVPVKRKLSSSEDAAEIGAQKKRGRPKKALE